MDLRITNAFPSYANWKQSYCHGAKRSDNTGWPQKYRTVFSQLITLRLDGRKGCILKVSEFCLVINYKTFMLVNLDII